MNVIRGGAPARVACLLVAVCLLPQLAPACAASLDFSSAVFDIFNADGSQLIGESRYDVTQNEEGYLVVNTAKFKNGEYDIERDRVKAAEPDKPLAMVSFDHIFYHADQTMFMRSQADFATGEVICTNLKNHQLKQTRQTMNFPSDTYAGAGTILPVQAKLLAGDRAPIAFHDFVCMPGPRLLAIDATMQPEAHWAHFPGDLIQAMIKPNLGWISFVAAPFLPTMHAWFDPASNFDFVGGKFSRYYGGPEIILARTQITRSDQSTTAARGN